MSNKNRKAKRHRTKGLGRPLKKTHPRIRLISQMVGIAFGLAITILGLMILGELAMLVMAAVASSPTLLSAMNAFKAGIDVADTVATLVAVIAVLRAIFKDRAKR